MTTKSLIVLFLFINFFGQLIRLVIVVVPVLCTVFWYVHPVLGMNPPHSRSKYCKTVILLSSSRENKSHQINKTEMQIPLGRLLYRY